MSKDHELITGSLSELAQFLVAAGITIAYITLAIRAIVEDDTSPEEVVDDLKDEIDSI